MAVNSALEAYINRLRYRINSEFYEPGEKCGDELFPKLAAAVLAFPDLAGTIPPKLVTPAQLPRSEAYMLNAGPFYSRIRRPNSDFGAANRSLAAGRTKQALQLPSPASREGEKSREASQ